MLGYAPLPFLKLLQNSVQCLLFLHNGNAAGLDFGIGLRETSAQRGVFFPLCLVLVKYSVKGVLQCLVVVPGYSQLYGTELLG